MFVYILPTEDMSDDAMAGIVPAYIFYSLSVALGCVHILNRIIDVRKEIL